MPIRVLDRGTVSRIAAGEVVERPASVVKELVENALDAGSGRIAVEVRGGGVSLIRVTDNGCGIPAGEAVLAFERHATSKIKSLKDLEDIRSLGFRGEALPSIAAVAGVEVSTCAGDEPAGTYLSLKDGKVAGHRSQARAKGTTIAVRDLFRQVPARLKFLKSTATENSHIANVVTQYALAYPEVAFTLISDGRQVLHTPGRGELIECVVEVYGVETAGRMLEIGDGGKTWPEEETIRVSGLAGAPETGRAGRGYLSFFVNRRWVSSRLLAWAVEEAYSGLLMTGKHPVAVINLSVPPQETDVNIHPAKTEIKFRDERAVFGAVQKAVRRVLVAQTPVPIIEEAAAPFRAPEKGIQELWSASTGRTPGEKPATSQPMFLSLPVLRVVGQVMNSYIVAEGPDGLYVIDQHAAHERIRFEQVRRQRAARQVESQGLLEPVTFEVSPRQDEELRSSLGELSGFGFSLEPFGARTYLVRAVPGMVGRDGWAGMLRELLDSLAGETGSRREERITASIACHNAVRSGQSLSDDEMRELIRELERTENPHTCPHGRPTMIHLSLRQLEKEFGRG